VIHQYLADARPAAGLAPARGTRERLQLEEALVFLSTELHKNFSPLFAPTSSDEAKAAFRDKIVHRLGHLDAQFADGRPFLTGQTFTVADAYLFTLTNWTKFVGIDLAQWPALATHAGRVAQRPAVQAALKAEGLLAA